MTVPRRPLPIGTTVGHALYVAQAVLGIVALAALVRVSPWLGGLLVVLPLAAVGVVAVRRMRAHRAGAPSSR